MNAPLIEKQTEVGKLAAEFREMADRMEQNGDSAFGGCFVVVDSQGNMLKTLILDKSQDAGQFWTLLRTKCDMTIAGLDDAMRNQQAFGRR